MNWKDAADVRKKWGKQFCLKGIMSAADAKRAVDIGATAIMVSNHGGRNSTGRGARLISSPRSSMLLATR
jgi:L-lactate dehydrogenase (cytochrome)